MGVECRGSWVWGFSCQWLQCYGGLVSVATGLGATVLWGSSVGDSGLGVTVLWGSSIGDSGSGGSSVSELPGLGGGSSVRGLQD